MQEETKVELEARFSGLSTAAQLTILLDYESYMKFRRHETIAREHYLYLEADKDTNEIILQCVTLVLGRNVHNVEPLQENFLQAITSDPKLLKALSLELMNNLTDTDRDEFQVNDLTLFHYATMSGNDKFVEQLYKKIQSAEHAPAFLKNLHTVGLPNCLIAARFSNIALMLFWIAHSTLDTLNKVNIFDAIAETHVDVKEELFIRELVKYWLAIDKVLCTNQLLNSNINVDFKQSLIPQGSPLLAAAPFPSSANSNNDGTPPKRFGQTAAVKAFAKTAIASPSPLKPTRGPKVEEYGESDEDIANGTAKGKEEASSRPAQRHFSRPPVSGSTTSATKKTATTLHLDRSVEMEPGDFGHILDDDERFDRGQPDREPLLGSQRNAAPSFEQENSPPRDIAAELTRLVMPIAQPPVGKLQKRFSYFELFNAENARKSGEELLGILRKLGLINLLTNENQDPTIIGVLAGNIYRLTGSRITFPPFTITDGDGVPKTIVDAIKREGYSTFKEALEHKWQGLKTYQRSIHAITILHLAIVSGVYDMIKLVLELCVKHGIKINVNDVDSFGRNCGHYVALRGSFFKLNAPRLIKDQPFDVKEWDNAQQINIKKTIYQDILVETGMSPIPSSHIIDLLNRYVNNFTVFDRVGETALHTAVLNNNVDLIPELQRVVRLNINDMDAKRKDNVTVKGLSMLHLAVLEGVNATTLCYIIKKYFTIYEDGREPFRSLEEPDSDGFTALHYAIARGNVVAMLVLLAFGADKAAKSNTLSGSISALDIAVKLTPVVQKVKGQDEPNMFLKCSTQIPNLTNRLKAYGADCEKQRPITQEELKRFERFLNDAERVHGLNLEMDLTKEERFRKVTDGASFKDKADHYCYLPSVLLAYILELKPTDVMSKSFDPATRVHKLIVKTRQIVNLRTAEDADKLIRGRFMEDNYNQQFSRPLHSNGKRNGFEVPVVEFSIALQNARNLVRNYYNSYGSDGDEAGESRSKRQHPGRRFHEDYKELYKKLGESVTPDDAVNTLKSILELIMDKIERDSNIFHGPEQSSAIKRIGISLISIWRSEAPEIQEDHLAGVNQFFN